MGEGHGDYVTTKQFLKSFQVSCHPFPAVLQDSQWKTALSTPVLEISVVRRWGFGCQWRGRVSWPFSPIRGREAARSPAFCRNEGGCVGPVGLSGLHREMAEGNWGNWEAAAVPQQSGGEGFAPERSSPRSLLLLRPTHLQSCHAAGGEMGVRGASHPLSGPKWMPWSPRAYPACLSPVRCCSREYPGPSAGLSRYLC